MKLIIFFIVSLFLYSCGEDNKLLFNNIIPLNPNIRIKDFSGENTLRHDITLSLSNAQVGSKLVIYTDKDCTQLIARFDIITKSQDVTVENLLNQKYDLYYLTNKDGLRNRCRKFQTINIHSCPDGYSRAYGKEAYGTKDFCVMEYEAKNNGSDLPISKPEDAPWVNLTIVEAKNNCQALGEGYDLISNPEWVTIANNISSLEDNIVDVDGWPMVIIGNTQNWYGNQHIYEGPTPDYGTGRNTLARHILSSGDYVYDMGGNVFEFVDWTLSEELGYPPGDCGQEMRGDGSDFYGSVDTVSCSSMQDYEYYPQEYPYPFANSNLGFPGGNLYSLNGLGNVYLGNANLSNYAAVRSGGVTQGIGGGVFYLALFLTDSSAESYAGFRCVFRPF